MKTRTAFLVILLFASIQACEPPATGFEEIEDAVYYFKSPTTNAPAPDSTIRVMTWNIRFGIGRGPWFGDACGYRVTYSRDEVIENLKIIVDHINQANPDVLLLQEVDVDSKRSGYVDQLRWILDRTHFNFAVYGSQWKSQFIPSDGLGRMHEVNAVLSRWPISDAQRIQLDLRNDQDALERYYYERCCIVKARISIPGFRDFYALNTHASAFATDDSKRQHINEFKHQMDLVSAEGMNFVAGGDINTLPPGTVDTDFCDEDMCEGESYHNHGDNPMHKEGSNYEPEADWLVPVYESYKCAVPLDRYLVSPQNYFTHTTRPDQSWDRTIDYMFTNHRWRKDSDLTHQEFMNDSDHAAVSAEFSLKK